ncbi:arsenate-mycothiol transferase ArsC [Salinimonas chungwhensis]|uniref:arsenate-mycothiol transferase ArsC n=1 Tax=Salinimonas chungwhensis TaxID=265425 RepID=UPI000378B4A4|nr:hypothetical protein [Salinimonas chungwhensis]
MSVSQYIADTYGSKRGLARYVKFNARRWLGAYKGSCGEQIKGTKRLIFICSGNICRSPFGEYVAHRANFPADSYGLHCRGGDEAFAKTLDYGRRHEYPVEEHRSKHINDYTPQEDDLLVVMEPAHLDELDALFPETKKVLLGLFADPPTVYLHDPFNTNVIFFNKCMKKIELATRSLIEAIKK